MSVDKSCTECAKRQAEVEQLFAHCTTAEDRYHVLIALGKALKPLDPLHKIPQNEVSGCQSLTYLHGSMDQEGRVHFEGYSEALISAGLAALLIRVYSGLPATAILTCKAHYLEKMEINSSLSPNRATGLYSIHLKMRQEALRLFMEREREKTANHESIPTL